jgi:hypothetical protein
MAAPRRLSVIRRRALDYRVHPRSRQKLHATKRGITAYLQAVTNAMTNRVSDNMDVDDPEAQEEEGHVLAQRSGLRQGVSVQHQDGGRPSVNKTEPNDRSNLFKKQGS